MAGELFTTQDREEIIEWAENREAHAARVTGAHPGATPDDDAPEVGALRLGFVGYASPEATEPMTWDAWFEQFEADDLTFAYQRTQADGSPSNYYEIHAPNT